MISDDGEEKPGENSKSRVDLSSRKSEGPSNRTIQLDKPMKRLVPQDKDSSYNFLYTISSF